MAQITYYELQSELGRGGMGTVYKGIDTRSGITVAIKQLKTEIAQPENIERFKREGEALRELNHPNIVKMLDMFEQEGQHYLVLEYVSGGDLKDMIEQSEQIPYEQCVDMAIDLADALTRAHRLNIIHRDLKPANVLIGDDGVLRLTDFGVAHVGGKDRVTETDMIVGTINYLPPEAFSGINYDARGDIWAFGVMLFEMVAGQHPFNQSTLASTLQAIVSQPIPDLEMLCPHVPIALLDLIYRMLQRDPQARISNVRHVGAILEDILNDRDDTGFVPQEPRFHTPTPVDVRTTLTRHNLPAISTPFVGRDTELMEVVDLLKQSQHRLITILAPGGMGKTRLALETARACLRIYPDGVFFVELAPLSDPDKIYIAVAEAVGYQFQIDSRTSQEQLFDYLRDKRMLLVMDNFEHLIANAGSVSEFLKVGDDLNIIATSRERLNLSGEMVVALDGLDVPDSDHEQDANEYSAIQLFVQSARQVQPDFELNDSDVPEIVGICAYVDGSPLGIVLAASWLEMLSIQEIAHEIAASIDFLESTMRDIPERHRSMRAVFDYSWNLLAQAEQDVLMKLSIFRGGFTREAAQAITGASLRTLMTLMHKSLITRDVGSGRYNIHELTRQYAEMKLKQSTEYDQVSDAHSQYYLQQFVQFEKDYLSAKQAQETKRIEQEFDNIVVGIEKALADKQHDRLVSALRGLAYYYFMVSSFAEGAAMFMRIENNMRDGSSDRQPLKFWQARIYRLFLQQVVADPSEIETLALEAIAPLEQVDALSELAFNEITLTRTYMWLGDLDRAMQHAERSKELAESLGDMWGIVNSKPNLAYIEHLVGHTYRAIEMQLEVLKLAQDNGSPPFWLALAYLNLGEYHHAVNETGQAKHDFEQCFHYATEINNYRTMGYALTHLGNLAHYEGKYEESVHYNRQSLRLLHDIGDRQGQADALLRLADALRYQDKIDESTHCLQEALAFYKILDNKQGMGNVYALLALNADTVGHIDDQLDYSQKSLDVRRQVGNPKDIVDGLQTLGIFTGIHRDIDRGLQLMDEADDLVKKYQVDNDEILGRSLGMRCVLLMLSERYEDVYTLLTTNDYWRQNSYRWGVMQESNVMGFACLCIDKLDEAIQNLKDGLSIALEINALSSSIASIAGFAYLLSIKHNQHRRSLAMLMYLERNWSKSLQGRYVFQALELDDIRTKLSPDELAQAEADSQSLELESIAQELMELFKDDA